MAENQSKPTSPTPSKPTPRTERTERDTVHTTETPATAPGMAELPVEIPTEDGAVVPTPGDPRTEPVATAEQSWVPGRVGPRTIPEDAMAASQEAGRDGLDETMPGAILTDTPEGLGRVPDAYGADPVGERLARIAEDINEGVPLNGQGQRVDGLGQPLPASEQAGRVSR